MQLFIISGLSGSGKSVALNVLEDAGYYCVDNLPADLLIALVAHLRAIGYQKIAVSVDVRSANSVQKAPAVLSEIKATGINVHVIFLDAHSYTLVKRFSESRRLHPLNDGVRTLPECVQYERELLADLSRIGHHLDTSEITANGLRAWVKSFITVDHATLTLLFQSFGFKHGIPLDADFVFDVRCLPNPHYNAALQPLTGKDAAVIAFLDDTPDAQAMFTHIRDFITRWLPNFIADNRSYLTVAIGCTGGQHRSVYLAEKLAQHFATQQQILLRHRELAQ
jgi:RNase adapter protein RapZ